MKKYSAPALEVSAFDTEDIMIVSGTEAPLSPDLGGDLIKDGYSFVSKVAEEGTPEVKAGAAFSWK